MLKRILEYLGILEKKQVRVEIPVDVTPEPITEEIAIVEEIVEAPKPTRTRKPRTTSDEAPKKAPRKRKPKSE